MEIPLLTPADMGQSSVGRGPFSDTPGPVLEKGRCQEGRGAVRKGRTEQGHSALELSATRTGSSLRLFWGIPPLFATPSAGLFRSDVEDINRPTGPVSTADHTQLDITRRITSTES